MTGRSQPTRRDVAFGALVADPGTVWYDDVRVDVRPAGGAWSQVPLSDLGFEGADALSVWKPGIARGNHDNAGWNVAIDHDFPAAGVASLRISHATETLTAELFDDAPAPGETVDVDLGGDLRARVPIALYSKDGHTLGDDPEVARRSQAGAPPAAGAGFDPVAGAADVIVAWNVLDHFWPYWDVVQINWTDELDTALADALDDCSAEDHLSTLERLSVAAPDGHARVSCPGTSRVGYLPFAVAWIEAQLVVTASDDDRVRRGDVVTAIDGRATAEVLDDAEALVSGSPQWRRVRGLGQVGTGAPGSTARVHLRRGATGLDVMVTRVARATAEPYAEPPIAALPGGVWYVDLGRAAMKDIDAVMPKLAAAPGVVLDMRGYPNRTHPVLNHLLTRPDDSKWMSIAHVIRPDHATPPAWSPYGWDMAPMLPHIGGRVAVLTGPGAISYAESVMGFVEGDHLGVIVGAATAGTNGNIAEIAEPTGCHTSFTGMRVTRHDGTRSHLIGIEPTVPVEPTVAGVRAGRDEVLEKALELVRGPVPARATASPMSTRSVPPSTSSSGTPAGASSP